LQSYIISLDPSTPGTLESLIFYSLIPRIRDLTSGPQRIKDLNTGEQFLEKDMSFYIVCQKKRNNPRMDVRICEKKCDLKDGCKEFVSFNKPETKGADIRIQAEPHNVQMGL